MAPGARPGGPVGDELSAGQTGRVVRGMFWMAWGGGASALLKIAVLVVLTRLLSPDDFGMVGAALIIIGFSLAVSELGMGPALVQRPVLEPRHLSTAFAGSVVLGLVMAGIVWLSASAFAGFFHMPALQPVVRALVWLFPIKGLSAAAENLAQRELRFRWLANVEVITYAVGYGLVGVVLAWGGAGIWALVGAQLSFASLKAAIVLRAIPPTLRPRPQWAAFRELLEFGAGSSAAQLGVLCANEADNFVVGRWLGASALGLYSRAYQLMAVPTALFGTVLDSVLFPSMARVQDDARRLSSAYLRGTALLALVMLPLGVVVCMLGPELIRVVFGERWTPMVPAFQLLALGMMFRTSYRMSDSLARATGAVYRRAWRQGVYAALVFAGALIGQRWGITGVAAAVLGALFLNFLLMAQLALGITRVSWRTFWDTHLPALWSTAVVGGIGWFAAALCREWGLPPAIRLAAVVSVVLGVAVLLLWRVPQRFLGPDGVWMLDVVRAVISRRFGAPPPTEILDEVKP